MKFVCPICEGFGLMSDFECQNCHGHGVVGAPAAGQSRKMSAVEVIVGTAIGFVVALITTHFVMPAFGHPVTVIENLGITAIFTVVSIARGYCVRRLFEAWRHV